MQESIPAGTVDVIMCIFVLSAISPEKMVVAVDNMVRILRKNSRSRIFVRDYAAGDLAEVSIACVTRDSSLTSL
jgi:hypothetical protein